MKNTLKKIIFSIFITSLSFFLQTSDTSAAEVGSGAVGFNQICFADTKTDGCSGGIKRNWCPENCNIAEDTYTEQDIRSMCGDNTCQAWEAGAGWFVEEGLKSGNYYFGTTYGSTPGNQSPDNIYRYNHPNYPNPATAPQGHVDGTSHGWASGNGPYSQEGKNETYDDIIEWLHDFSSGGGDGNLKEVIFPGVWKPSIAGSGFCGSRGCSETAKENWEQEMGNGAVGTVAKYPYVYSNGEQVSCPQDCTAVCNFDNICDVNIGENINNCPSDCSGNPPPSPTTCADGTVKEDNPYGQCPCAGVVPTAYPGDYPDGQCPVSGSCTYPAVGGWVQPLKSPSQCHIGSPLSENSQNEFKGVALNEGSISVGTLYSRTSIEAGEVNVGEKDYIFLDKQIESDLATNFNIFKKSLFKDIVFMNDTNSKRNNHSTATFTNFVRLPSTIFIPNSIPGALLRADSTGTLVPTAVDTSLRTTFIERTLKVSDTTTDSGPGKIGTITCPVSHPVVLGGGGACLQGDLFKPRHGELMPTGSGWQLRCNEVKVRQNGYDDAMKLSLICGKAE
ncbi:MAG: hypothetical protein ACI9AR_000094 [Flavobacteriaceae bacterium]|jgi:hypothetical protein